MSVIITSRRRKAEASCRGSSPRVWGWPASAAFLVAVLLLPQWFATSHRVGWLFRGTIAASSKRIRNTIQDRNPPSSPTDVARPGSGGQKQPQTPIFHVGAEMVLLHVSVKDAKGVPVMNLERGDFTVFEDGVAQPITYFEKQFGERPIPSAIALIMDVSSSMKGSSIGRAREAALQFIEESPPRAEIALLSFDEASRLLCDFTEDRSSLQQAVTRLEPRGGTALYDALSRALDLLDEASRDRKVLVLLSDGIDLDSHNAFSDVERRVRASSVSVYAVGHYSDYDRKNFMTGEKYYKEPAFEVNLNPVWVLRELAGVSGGKAVFPAKGHPLAPLFVEIARELHHQYILGYAPGEASGEPRFRSVEVRIDAEASDGPLQVRSRRGYVR